MKNITLLVFLVWVFVFTSISSIAQEINSDATIENEKIITDYDFSIENKMPVYRKRVTIKRRIRINSLLGIENLNKLYIPTFKDLSYSHDLVHVYAKTIKENGDEIIVNRDNMQETTLPGNLYFLYGFEGNVLQFAFENVQVNDVIEYNYTIQYNASKSYGYWDIDDELDISSEYPILEGEYIFKLDKHTDGMFAVSDPSLKMNYNEEDNSYRITIKNIEPITEESYVNDKEDLIFIRYEVTNYPNGLDHSWEDYFTNLLSRTKGKDYFFGGITISDLIKESKKSTDDPVDKINAIIDYLGTTYKSDAYAVYRFSQSYNVGMVDVKNLIHLFNEIEINAEVIFVRDKQRGTFMSDFYSLSQFNSVLILFKDASGKDRYWEPFAPLNRIDDISYTYQGSNGLRVDRVKKDILVSTVIVPTQSSDNNIASRTVNIDLTRGENKLTFLVSERVDLYGENATDEYLGYYLESIDSTLSFYSDYKKEEYEFRFPNCVVDTVILDEIKDSIQIGFVIRYSYSIPFGDNYESIIMEVQDVVGKIVFSEVERERVSNAVFDYPFEIRSTFIIDSSAESIDENIFLNSDFTNEFITFNCNTTIDQSSILLDVKYAQKVGVINPEKWSVYVKAMDEVFSFYNQKIRFNY